LGTEEVQLRSLSKGIIDIPVHGENYLIYEILAGSELQPNTNAFYIFLVLFSISLVIILSIVSTLNRFWFIVGMGLFCVFVITLRLESVQVIGMPNQIFSIVIVVLFCSMSFYFHAIRTHSNFIIRFFSFSVLYIAYLATTNAFSQVQDPLLHISINGFAIAVLSTIIFILMIAHEIPAAFINVITQGNRQSKSMQHFLVISVFYLINLLIAYGIKIGYIHLTIWVIDLYLLFTFSSILSIWGFRQREPQYESIFQAEPLGIYFIIAMAIMSFGTIGYFMATANDTVLIVLKDLIIYSHLGYGIIFVFYVIANFGSMLTKNLQVHKVLYKPNTMPYFTFRLMGLICTFAFLVFDTNWRTPFNQVVASYHNSYGDLYLAQGDADMAESYYNKSVLFRNQNHHAHYALAAIQAAKLEPGIELDHWKAASESFPVEQTLLNLMDSYRRNRKISEALEVVEKAKGALPHTAALYNAKGMIYSQLKMPDSAMVAFQQARKSKYMKEIAETNLLAASVRFKIAHPADSLLLLLGSDKEGPKANALALANLQNTPIQISFSIGSDTILSATKAAFICNYFINQRESVDTTLINMAVDLARRPVNDVFKDHLLIASAEACYAQGMIKRAFDLTREVAYRSGAGKYFLMLGNWALEQGNPEIASNYFVIAKEKQIPIALFREALAQTEDHDFTRAGILWEGISRSPDSSYTKAGQKMIAFINTNQNLILSTDDEIKYLYCRYKLSLEDSILFNKIINSITDEELKTRALLDYSKRWYAIDENETAARYLNLTEGLTPSRESTLAEFYYLNSMLLAHASDWPALTKQINNITLLRKYYKNEIIYWQALLDEKDGKKEEAKRKFEYLGKANTYFEEGLIVSSQFLSKDTTVDRLKSYSILVDGLMVKPNSVKLLKAYIKEAAIIGFDDEAAESLEKLKTIIPRSSFNRFIKENPDFFDVE
jgi:hypothetical protein